MLLPATAGVGAGAEQLLRTVEDLLRSEQETLCRSAEMLLGLVDERLAREREIVRLRGENFNVFRLLRVEADEDRLHSAFIGELLDPCGSHDQGYAFLELFLATVGKKDYWPEPAKTRVKREYDIGTVVIDGEDSKGGRIDIFITDGTRHLSIENKIWSNEGEKQITRYCNSDSDNHHVLFLTLDGHGADTRKTNYSPISYRVELRRWLESCQRHAADQPILRETIKQYLLTTKALGGELTMQETEERLMELMRQHPSAARMIRDNYDRLIQREVGQFRAEVVERLKGMSPIQEAPETWQVTTDLDDVGAKWAGVKICRTFWDDTAVGWYGDSSFVESPIYGVSHHKDKPGRVERDSWRTELAKIMGGKTWSSDNWPCYAAFDPARFRDDAAVAALLDRVKRAERIEQVTQKLVELITFCDKELRRSDS
ncbi:MAG: PD-(D/E)XK nuclease family protein [Acidobacteria bacterium]|nr:PD-(D/E)XK nuclease family protein [Acidobacteriota bacterium]